MSQSSPIPKRLKEARIKAGLSQKELGVAAGIDPFVASPRVNQYERGKHTPDYGTVTRFAEALKVPVPFFYAEEDGLAELIVLAGGMKAGELRRLLKQLAPHGL